MAQTTGAVPRSCAYIGISSASDCSAYTNVSGSVNSVTGAGGQSKMVGEEYTFDGNYALVEVGKIEPVDITVRCVFTTGATEAYRLARTAFMTASCDGKICLRVIPGGATAGNEGFETGYSPVTSGPWPDVNAAEAGPVMVEFTVHAAMVDPFVYVS